MSTWTFSRARIRRLSPPSYGALAERPEIHNLFVEDEGRWNPCRLSSALILRFIVVGKVGKKSLSAAATGRARHARIFLRADDARLHQTDYYLGCLNLSSLAGLNR